MKTGWVFFGVISMLILYTHCLPTNLNENDNNVERFKRAEDIKVDFKIKFNKFISILSIL